MRPSLRKPCTVASCGRRSDQNRCRWRCAVASRRSEAVGKAASAKPKRIMNRRFSASQRVPAVPCGPAPGCRPWQRSCTASGTVRQWLTRSRLDKSSHGSFFRRNRSRIGSARVCPDHVVLRRRLRSVRIGREHSADLLPARRHHRCMFPHLPGPSRLAAPCIDRKRPLQRASRHHCVAARPVKGHPARARTASNPDAARLSEARRYGAAQGG